MNKKYLLNTRPLDQSIRVRQAFKFCDFEVIDLPCLEIVSSSATTSLLDQMRSLSDHSAVIFTSQYAVQHAFAILPQWCIDNTCQVIAVGTKTAEMLEQHFVGHIWVPTEQNSQGVIDLLKGMEYLKAVSLVTAPDGRKQIERFAGHKNLDFQQINVYQRQQPQWRKGELDEVMVRKPLYVIVTSIATLNNLAQGLSEKHWHQLLEATLICASSRIVSCAQSMGFEQCINSASANPKIMATVIKHHLAG